ncbi:hypothetical protein QPK13_06220 [Photorhabdus tasmaniensis]
MTSTDMQVFTGLEIDLIATERGAQGLPVMHFVGFPLTTSTASLYRLVCCAPLSRMRRYRWSASGYFRPAPSVADPH